MDQFDMENIIYFFLASMGYRIYESRALDLTKKVAFNNVKYVTT